MLLTKNQLEAGAPRDHRPGRIQLRIRVPAVADELVELPIGKTTVGSGPRCQVRIQQPGVQPLHCLIVHEADGITVRRWASDTLLNGTPFDEAPLAAGDVLSLGPVNVEIIGASLTDIFYTNRESEVLEESSNDRFELIASEEAAASSAEPPAEDAADLTNDTMVHHTTVWLGNDSSVGEAPEEVAQQAVEQVEQPIELAAARKSAEASASNEVVAAEGAREVFRQMQVANALSRARCRKLLQALRTRRDAYRMLESRVGELEHQIEIMSRDDDSTEFVVRGPSKESVDWHAAEVARLTCELQLQRQRIHELEEQLARAVTMVVVAEPASDAGSTETALESAAQEEHCTEQWPGLQDAATEPFLAPAMAGELSATEPRADTTIDLTSRPSGGETQPITPELATDAGADEESIEQYMAKLLQRVRGDSPSAIVPPYVPQMATPQAAATEPAATELDLPAPVVVEPEPDESTMSDLSEMVRSDHPPETPTDLDALRALANESARRAIGVHASHKHRRDAVTKFIVASLAGMTSIWLMMLAPTWLDWQFITACVGWVVAAYWAGQTYGKLLEYARAGDYDGPEPEFDG